MTRFPLQIKGKVTPVLSEARAIQEARENLPTPTWAWVMLFGSLGVSALYMWGSSLRRWIR